MASTTIPLYSHDPWRRHPATYIEPLHRNPGVIVEEVEAFAKDSHGRLLGKDACLSYSPKVKCTRDLYILYFHIIIIFSLFFF